MHKKLMVILSITLLFLVGCTSTTTPTGAITAQPTLPVGSFTLNTDASTLSYEASKITSNKHTGTVKISKGTLIIHEGTVQGDFLVDMTSITEDTSNERFIGHIKSDDFFDVSNNPTSKFVIRKITLQENTYVVTGDLTIKGITNPITFPARVDVSNGLHITGNLVINRLDWDITFNSGSLFKDLGDKAIKDEILVGLDLVLS